ncbi:MAG: IS1634 family transposase [Woeseiaceae bacterium]
MYIETVPNRNSRPAILLREGWREGKKVCKRTLANLSDWPAQKVAALRRVLKDEPLVSPQEAFAIERSWPHGHVEAVLETIRRIGLDKLIGAKRTRERDLVLAMIVERLIAPCSKLATTRMWHSTTLAQLLQVEDADEEELYAAMDWLLERQGRIEKRLGARHLGEGQQVLYDVSSSYYEGHTCPLVCFGHSRDGKRGKPILVYGVLTDVQGRPVAVQVYPGNTGDPSTVADQVEKLKGRFALERVVLVGDRGMLTQTQIEVLKAHPGIGWISALRSEKVRKLLDEQHLQLSLFDERNLAEIRSVDFPDERLVACFNPLLAEERRRKRTELLDATEQLLEKIRLQVQRRTKTPLSAAQIGQKVGKVINRHKVGKHFEVSIADAHFSFSRRTAAIEREAELDGLYVIRTSEPRQALSADDTVRSYKNLAQVERAFRTLKGADLRIRPIHHRGEERVRAHIFLCLLAYYVQWHMRQALSPLLFDDETLPIERKRRDPVAPAEPSASARRKKTARETEDGFPIHSFETLMAQLGTRCRHLCRLKSDVGSPAFFQDTLPTPLQTHALELIRLFPVPGL